MLNGEHISVFEQFSSVIDPLEQLADLAIENIRQLVDVLRLYSDCDTFVCDHPKIVTQLAARKRLEDISPVTRVDRPVPKIGLDGPS